jgi:outer membrane protein TolC
VLSYAELQKWEERLARLHEVESDAERMQTAVSDRVKEGVDSEIDATKARLSLARTRLRVAEAQGAADVLRERLSKLTGLPAAGIQTEPDSIPARPEVTPGPNTGTANNTAVESNPGVQAAVEHARAQFLRAQGEHRTLWPTADFATQYAVLSRFNHYQDYFQPGSFKRNNASIGVVLRFPFLNASQRARAEGADAEAMIARKQSESVRDQVSEATLRLRLSVTQMQAAHDVAQLEYELAQKNLDAVQTRTDSGNGTLHDLDEARTQASERFIALQDVSFELERVQVELLRSTGDLEKWALGAP